MTAPDPTFIPYRDDLRRVERAGFGAWPALESVPLDGWIWRNSGGGFGRSNSTFTLDYTGTDAPGSVATIESWYRMRGRRARFRVSDVTEPADLLATLTARGYTRETGALILAKPVESRKADLSGIEWSQFPSPNWLRVYLGVIDEPRRRTVADILAQVPQPLVYVSQRTRGITLSCGLATIEDGIATIECIATREETRRRGGAEAVLAGIENWAHTEGAHTLHLQVAETNHGAVALYRKFGFEEVGRFAYWVADAMRTPPLDDGGADHFRPGTRLSPLTLQSVSGSFVDPASLPGRAAIVVYPWTGRPGLANPPEWDELLGAHGSTPELQGFRDHTQTLNAMGIRIVAISGQSSADQREMVQRLGLPFVVLSDAHGRLRDAWRLPTFAAGSERYLSRLTLLCNGGRVARCLYPAHPAADQARQVIDWFVANPV